MLTLQRKAWKQVLKPVDVAVRHESSAAASALRSQGQGAHSAVQLGGDLVSKPQARTLTRDIERKKGTRERIIVLGSGWAGYTLARELDSKRYQVVVVSPRSYFVFTPLLASTSVGTLEFRNTLEPVRSRRTGVDFFQGWADSVNFAEKTLTIEEAVNNTRQGFALTADQNEKAVEKKRKGRLIDMSYDKLVIAVGCYSQTFNTPGVKDNAYFLKDVGDAKKIRNRLLSCFELAALPTTPVEMKKVLLNFAVVGGGPTGIEWSAELYDLIHEDMAKLYPSLMQYYKITVYDVAEKVLSMFDDKLANYATDHFHREGIQIRTKHHVESLTRGLPAHLKDKSDGFVDETNTCYTLKLKEEGEVAVGMCVWSTGLMMNPFVTRSLRRPYELPSRNTELVGGAPETSSWQIEQNSRSGAIITNDRLRVLMNPTGSEADEKSRKAVMNDVYALGDCAMIKDTRYPATAQVANQKARWLAQRLNKRDIETRGFTYKDLGIMAYIGNWNAILQHSGGDVSGKVAWFVWRGAYLAKSVSWRNRILIPGGSQVHQLGVRQRYFQVLKRLCGKERPRRLDL